MLSVHATPKNESNQGLCATHQPSATCECNEGSTPHTHKDSVLGRSVQLCVCVCFSKKFPRYELGVSARCIRCLERKHHRIDNSMHNLTSNIFALAVGCNFTLRKHIRKNTQCLCVWVFESETNGCSIFKVWKFLCFVSILSIFVPAQKAG